MDPTGINTVFFFFFFEKLINIVLDLVSIFPLIKVKYFWHIVSGLPLYTFIYNEFNIKKIMKLI